MKLRELMTVCILALVIALGQGWVELAEGVSKPVRGGGKEWSLWYSFEMISADGATITQESWTKEAEGLTNSECHKLRARKASALKKKLRREGLTRKQSDGTWYLSIKPFRTHAMVLSEGVLNHHLLSFMVCRVSDPSPQAVPCGALLPETECGTLVGDYKPHDD